MRAGLRDGSLPVDVDGGWLHDIADETDVVAPGRSPRDEPGGRAP